MDTEWDFVSAFRSKAPQPNKNSAPDFHIRFRADAGRTVRYKLNWAPVQFTFQDYGKHYQFQRGSGGRTLDLNTGGAKFRSDD